METTKQSGFTCLLPHINEPIFFAFPNGQFLNTAEKAAYASKYLKEFVIPALDNTPTPSTTTPLNEPAGRDQSADLVETLLMDKDIWVEAVASNIGVARWFKGFVQSDEFSTLSNEEKGAAFDLFMNLETGMQILQENLLQIDAAETVIA